MAAHDLRPEDITDIEVEVSEFIDRIVGRPFEEERVFQAAYAYEQATQHRHPPPMFPPPPGPLGEI